MLTIPPSVPCTQTLSHRLGFSRAERTRVSAFYATIVLLHFGGWGLFLHYSSRHPALAGLGFVACMLGLRHAFDADHIAAIVTWSAIIAARTWALIALIARRLGRRKVRGQFSGVAADLVGLRRKSAISSSVIAEPGLTGLTSVASFRNSAAPCRD